VPSGFIIFIYIGAEIRRIAGTVGRGNVKGTAAGRMRGLGVRRSCFAEAVGFGSSLEAHFMPEPSYGQFSRGIEPVLAGRLIEDRSSASRGSCSIQHIGPRNH
jgi:hypothetical protein